MFSIKNLVCDGKKLTAMVILSDGQIAVGYKSLATDENTVEIIDERGEIALRSSKLEMFGDVLAMVTLPGKRFAVGCFNGFIDIYQLQEDNCVKIDSTNVEFERNLSCIQSLVPLSRDRFAAGGLHGAVYIYQLQENQFVQIQKIENNKKSLVFATLYNFWRTVSCRVCHWNKAYPPHTSTS